MDGFNEGVKKLEGLRDGGFIDATEYEKRKKELVDSYVLASAGSAVATTSVYPGYPVAGASNIVKLRGLPFGCTESDVINFFAGYKLDSDPVKFQMNAEGKHSGICFVRLVSEAEATRALSKSKQYMGQRYIEVFPSNDEEMGIKTAPVAATNWVRMRGLPFGSTKADIKAFFEGFTLTDASIFLVMGPDGRPSGAAFVQFSDEYESQRALLKDKEQIGTRYIELFLSNREECDSAIARAHVGDAGKGFGGFGMDPYGMGAYGMGGYGAMGYGMGGFGAAGFGGGYGMGMGKGMGKGFGGGGGKAGLASPGGDNVVRLRGLPFRATEQEILGFFAGLPVTRTAIAFAGGRPSGEAFVEFSDRYGLEGALQRNRQLLGSRYIEVFQATAAEMAAASSPAAYDPYAAMYGGAAW